MTNFHIFGYFEHISAIRNGQLLLKAGVKNDISVIICFNYELLWLFYRPFTLTPLHEKYPYPNLTQCRFVWKKLRQFLTMLPFLSSFHEQVIRVFQQKTLFPLPSLGFPYVSWMSGVFYIYATFIFHSKCCNKCNFQFVDYM